uniref:Uncharacterized protein n=1 Tax=Magnetospirillum gryphiswaldense TaxID=55518 RepID=A4TZM6_9PROT|nr:hypothetical protein MGR_3235 [Magnetospirillum gryphiswaldense MSR-1]
MPTTAHTNRFSRSGEPSPTENALDHVVNKIVHGGPGAIMES